MNESKKKLAQNREFALAVIIEAMHRGEMSDCDAVELAFESNGLHGEWTEERLEQLTEKINRMSAERYRKIQESVRVRVDTGAEVLVWRGSPEVAVR
jgi:hypothetical protein